ncbi:SDR family oxidoreductase [Candidatus Kapabacteria bacterium]|nr:SDR family oxidoreductase [Candidatus Kapabacteria bacterium]
MPKVLVTGAGKRLGKGIAINFARRGWDVIIHYNQSEEGAKEVFNYISETGQMACLLKADLRDSSAVEKSFKDVFENFGVPSVLINNAGVFPEAKPIEKLNEFDFEFAMELNTKAQFITSKIFAEYAQKGSRVINIASLGGLEIWKNRLPYHVSKAGSIHLTRALAAELAPKISVNSINPGVIVVPDDETDIPKPKESRIPMGRYGNVDDLFSAIEFFATCSNYITGQNISVDGGQHFVR